MKQTAPTKPWEPVSASIAHWKSLSRLWEISWTRSGGNEAVDAARRSRFNALVRLARGASPYFRQAYRALPDRDLDPHQVPVVTKPALMTHFDEWVTDPEVTRAGVTAFAADRRHIGERFLNRYVVWKSSGSTGEPGIYVQDGDSLATFDALMAAHLDRLRFAAQNSWELLARGGRAALIAATGDHFASIASWQRVCQNSPWIQARGFSILDPLPQLVSQLNDYQPVFLASYPTMLSLLAEEQNAGRLRIVPLRLWSGGECLVPDAAAAIERAFGCPLGNEYGASECMSIAFGCQAGWLHVNADWVLLEPVDRDYRPTRPGDASHTVLLSNLANRVQPIIRYDLGDSIIAKPEPCACGNSLPAIRVEGRRDDVLSMRTPDGRLVQLLPLALTTIVEEAAHVHRFQIVQTAADRLMLRLDPGDDRDRQAAWLAAAGALRDYLATQSLPNVQVGLDKQGPLADQRSGKLREVVAMERASNEH
ncbi:MAG TPA: phenylacetate--CoA ligase family protein [Casimicrobiaceae bacterium]|nr:phenylacetate--CoA ligase family protein [Casimicrobiaceae bacterium]